MLPLVAKSTLQLQQLALASYIFYPPPPLFPATSLPATSLPATSLPATYHPADKIPLHLL
ncbi:MAG TPA: hypothetical protein ENG23_04185 [Methanomicrobia archaeon]|nr:hypothetical protein [Methanomicrobia archaeon]